MLLIRNYYFSFSTVLNHAELLCSRRFIDVYFLSQLSAFCIQYERGHRVIDFE